MKIGYMAGSVFGGILTVIGGLMVVSQMLYRFTSIALTHERKEGWGETIYSENDDEKMNLSLADFDDSFNFMIGMQMFNDEEYPDFDILDNEFFELTAYEVFPTWNEDGEIQPLTLKEKYELELCPQEYLLKFIKPATLRWYP